MEMMVGPCRIIQPAAEKKRSPLMGVADSLLAGNSPEFIGGAKRKGKTKPQIKRNLR
jgi:hypothetical protein